MNERVFHSRITRYATLLVALLIVCTCATAKAQNLPQWAISAYRIRVVLLFDVPPTSEEILTELVPRHLDQRTTAAIGALWNLEIVAPEGNDAHRLLGVFDDIPEKKLTELSEGCDKLVLLAISGDGMDYQIRCRAYDTFLELWTPPLEYQVAKLAEVPETAFWALRESFAPVAYFQADPKDDQRVTLVWKGSGLPSKAAAGAWVKEGDLIVPVMRRVDRDGKALEGGVEQVPWTYMEMTGDDQPAAKLHSHTKRPFGIRRRGNVEQNAILARGTIEPVTVRLVSKVNNELPLAGFDVYRQIPGEEESPWVGKSNLQGEVVVEPNEHPLELLYIKSGSQVLAKLPIAFNHDREISVPLVDDPVRLAAEAKINSIREELIDLVARRTILAARVRKQIEAKDYQGATQLLSQLEDLPGRAQFDQMLARQEQLSKSDNEMVQKRIDRLFSDTRVVLGHFLDARLATDLRNELSQAQGSGGN